MTEWMDRATALATLGVRAQTLYAYVSRGRIGSQPDPADPRRSLYRAADVAALVSRRSRGRRSADIAASVLSWGEPSIATAISTVRDGGLIYRGQDAAELAARATLEDVAQLLWQGADDIVFPSSRDGRAGEPFAALAGLAADGPHLLGRDPRNLRLDAAAAVAAIAEAVGAEAGGAALHQRLTRGWGLARHRADTLRRALVLLADHELNASTFAVRVAASTGASIAASLLAGLCALSGPRHGGAAGRTLELAEEAERSGIAPTVGRWLARDQPLPGFGHPLYPDGDPRAGLLLGCIDIDPVMVDLRRCVAEATGALPNVDFALAALARAYTLPGDAPFRLFMLARSVGWAAHAIEQAGTGRLIRPRATYVGPAAVE